MSDTEDPTNPEETGQPGAEDNQNEEELADEWAAAMAESGDDVSDDAADDVQQMPLDALKDEGTPRPDGEEGPELDVILDIPVRISMEVGATQIPIRNLLQLNQGSVVELERLAGEPI